jgi:hypothetical protein
LTLLYFSSKIVQQGSISQMFMKQVKTIEVLRCVSGTSNKVWGRFQTQAGDWWAFWGGFGNSASLKPHGNGGAGDYSSSTVMRSKFKKDYQPVDLDDFCQEWPDFEAMMSERLASVDM